ncbi:MAG: glycosyltransferase, partial [Novosphingobium sp.]
MKDVLVVIPCLNEEAHLPGLLGQLLADTPDATFVVADGGSTDRSRAIVEDLASTHPNLHLLRNPDRIQSAGMNRAVKK